MDLVVAYETDYDRITEAVEAAFDAFGVEVRGRTVLVKPNILGPLPPEKHVCTHPSLVAATIAALERRGAGRVRVGDNSGMRAYGSNEHAARASGILGVAGERYVNLGASPVRTPTGSEFADAFAVSREVLEADLLVSLPKMKTHVAAGITGGVKNTYGYLVGGEKMRLHREARGPDAFGRAIVDVYQVRPPDLTLLDAVVAMEGQGPSGGAPREVGRLLAATNAVALDVCMATMMGFVPERLPTPAAAAARGLGPAGMDGVRVEGPADPVPGFRLPRIGMGMGGWLARLATYLFCTKPRLRAGRCVKCGSCAAACPVEAITMTEAGPEIDYAKCIACFCCHEMCRYEAMDLARRMRLLQAQ